MTPPPAAPPPGPLDGVRVLDASTGIAGPMAAMYLADFGADVVKLEPPGGDPGRARPGFAMWNRNKRGIVIDPADAAARARRDAFLRGADVCLFSETLDALTHHGLDPETVRAGNGRLIYLHMPPFLPDATPWPGGGESAAMIEAGTGVAMRQPSVDPVPVDSVSPYVLYSQAMWGATAAVAALVEREASGAGQTVGVGGLHGMMQAMAYDLTLIPGAPFQPRPGGPGGSMPHYRLYECNDGRWLFLAALTPAFFLPVLDMLGLMHILADERLDGDPLAVALPENVLWAIGLLREAFLRRPRDEWLRLLAEIGCPSGPVEDRDDWLDHPQIEAIGMRAELDDPERGRVVMPGLPLNLTRSPAAIRTPAPTLGQHDAVVEPWPPQPSAPPDAPARDGPLAGVRVLDLGAIIAGPHAGALLAELGADVVKVETLDGDFMRLLGNGIVAFNKGKRSLSADLRSEAGHAIFLDLARDADIVIDNYRAGVLERLRIDYASVRAVNPEISTISLTGYGEGGELDAAPGFDPVLQAYSGMMDAQGGDGDPAFNRLPVNDVSSAATLALGAVLALLHQRRGGRRPARLDVAGRAGVHDAERRDPALRRAPARPSRRPGLRGARPARPLLPHPRRLAAAPGRRCERRPRRAGGARRRPRVPARRRAAAHARRGRRRPAGGSPPRHRRVGDGRRRAPLRRRRHPGDARAQPGRVVERPIARRHGGAAPVGPRRAGAGRTGVTVHRRAAGPLQPHREDRGARPHRGWASTRWSCWPRRAATPRRRRTCWPPESSVSASPTRRCRSRRRTSCHSAPPTSSGSDRSTPPRAGPRTAAS